MNEERGKKQGRDHTDSRQDGVLRSMFTNSFQAGGSEILEPIQLSVTIYRPELEHIDRVRSHLKNRGVGEISRNDLIRYGINLLSERDFLKG